VIRRLPRAALAAPLFALFLGCPSGPKRVAYDLAERTAVAERWSARQVLLFGTPGAEPQEAEGFYREAGGTGDTFLWAKGEAEIALQWRQVFPRVAILDLAPYRGLKAQSAEVRLNGKPVGRLTLNDERYRYRVALPAEAQRIGENRLGFLFVATGSPSASDPKNPDRRQLAAAFYSLAVGRAGDPTLDDLLGRDAPRPFSVTSAQGAPSLTLVGPSLVRFAIRLPPAAELRFTPDLHPGARAAAGAASFKVTFEDQEQGGRERVIWSRVISARDTKVREVVLGLPGAGGDIVRLGLQVGPAPSERFAWGVWGAPRVLGRGNVDPLRARPPSREEEAGADARRRSLASGNVLLVILDAARAREFGAYGYPRPTTPEIDRIASEGIVFENAFTPAAYTLGAMASVWTSQYPDRHHSEVSFSARLPKDRLTLAELLNAQGIFSAAFVANAVAGAGFGFDRGFSEFHEVFRDLGSGAEVFRRAVPPFLAAQRGSRFFLYLHIREPHFPYDPPPPFDTRFGPEGPIPPQVRRDIRWITDINQGRRPLAPGEREHLVRLYDGNLAFADQEVGALRKALEAEGLWERTVVIVAADHGEGLFEHGWIGHNVQVYDESVRVPLIVRIPGGRGPRRIPAFVDLLDLAPTIADLFGVLGRGGSEQAFQGRSLLPVLEGAPGKPLVLSRSVWDRPRYALRDPRFAFVYDTRTGEEALYDRGADPGETRDIGAEQPVRAAYYRQELHHWIGRLGQRSGTEAEAVKPTREQCENMRSMGYVPSGCQ
jgi:arylsulfatase A-like enzyme